MLTGKKTYITGALAIIGFIGAYVTGEATIVETAQAVIMALLAIFLKNGQANAVRSNFN